MALGFHCKAEQEKNLPSIASSISPRHSVPQVDDEFLNSSMYKCSSDSTTFGWARVFSHEDASTSSGEEDSSSVQSSVSISITSKDSEASDDDKSLSPRSAVSDVTSCVYSVMFLLRAQAAWRGRACASGAVSLLGYRTEPVPEDVSRTVKPAPKVSKTSKKLSKRVPKGRPTAAERQQRPKPAFPESAADSWVAKQRARATSEDDDAKVIRAARSILNKLTVEKFDSLFEQLVDCGIETPHHISMLMREVFEKATNQHHFTAMYAELCMRLASHPRISCRANFRHLLLDHCQHVFEQLLEPCGEEGLEDEEAQMQRKKRALGNIKLIGELLVQGMLSSSLLVECGKMLLESRMTCPEALESLAALLTVAGSKFDTRDWHEHYKLEDIFSEMDKLTKDKSTPPRIRFLLRDVLDVRGAGWRTSANQAALKASPMKLEEVREKAQEEQVATSPKRQSKNTPGKLNLECRRGPAGASNTNGSDDSISPTRPPKQKAAKGSSSYNASSSSLANLIQVVAKPRMSMPGMIPSEKQACQSVQKQALYDGATQGGEGLCANQVAAQTDASMTASMDSFDLVAFRRTLAATLTKLACDKNVPAAVQYIRLQQVPVECQRDQFVDILSRIVEERRGAVRRCELAFAAGLMATAQSPFDKKACLDGVRVFFKDVYEDMCTEVQRLPAILRSEFVPTMRSVFSASELNEVLPEEMRVA